MFLDKLPFNNIILLKKNKKYHDRIDVELRNDKKLKRFSSLDCHAVIYPFSRNICSKNIIFYPFEEYVKDIQSNQRSAYYKINSQFNKLFGLLIGLIIASLFYILKPQELFSIEPLISLIGAYFICKELWFDIENMLINITKKTRPVVIKNIFHVSIKDIIMPKTIVELIIASISF
jgi:hypothetical protein